jgi:hypothetical protein
LDKVNRKLHLSKIKHAKFNESGQLLSFYIIRFELLQVCPFYKLYYLQVVLITSCTFCKLYFL